MRAPIGMYRAGFGLLVGSRLVMLEHVGRLSGAARYVVLEVVSRPCATSVVVASALGHEAQWYQNLVAEPKCYVSIGFRRGAAAQATILDSESAARFLADYRLKYPALWKRLNTIMTALHDGDPDFVPPLVKLDFSPRPER